ncbi:alpha/beta hydrolase [Filimonas effusa]|uniref:Alpha/beta hydrolase n=2 Tax=Filimonas effusa TaxID=2508721 RepID=A0A4Q1DBD2_9BACT|nr:alpha/beta hydrolase [Filimonas effusa]
MRYLHSPRVTGCPILVIYTRSMKYTLMSFALLAGALGYAKAQTELPLYPNGQIPNSLPCTLTEGVRDIGQGNLFTYNTTQPAITAYLPAQPAQTHAAVIILPGGGYAGVSVTAEGSKVAAAFNQLGIAAFVVKYRMPSSQSMADKRTGALQDAQQALSIVRKNAVHWKIDPDKVGVAGFSAGGHLAAILSTRYRDHYIHTTDSTGNLRPDFTILVYPVISMDDSVTHAGSKSNLLGKNPSADDVKMFSANVQADPQTPPALLIHSGDDTVVDPENSILYYQALRKHGVSAQLIIYPKGGHGYGLDNPTTPDRWMDRCRDWMLSRKLL